MKLPNSTAPAWPFETIRQISDNWNSYIPTPPKRSTTLWKYGTCYNATFLQINYPEDEWIYKDIYNKQSE
jgi:hypothetical protein